MSTELQENLLLTLETTLLCQDLIYLLSPASLASVTYTELARYTIGAKDYLTRPSKSSLTFCWPNFFGGLVSVNKKSTSYQYMDLLTYIFFCRIMLACASQDGQVLLAWKELVLTRMTAVVTVFAMYLFPSFSWITWPTRANNRINLFVLM